jgi:hypothetical protein
MIKKALRIEASKLVAIVVPLSNRADLTPDEEISLRHLLHFLGDYDKYVVIPKSLRVKFPDFGIKRFDNKFFGSVAAHSRMLLSKSFYKAFKEYKFILIYHLDALVFSDQLLEWCKLDYDYVGAPWIEHPAAPYAGNEGYEGRVGNGGFSLRKIQSFMKVFNSNEYYMEPFRYWEKFFATSPGYAKFINFPKKMLMHLPFINNVNFELSRYQKNDEHFWSHRAAHYYPEFNIADVKTALRFAFECLPRYCFKLNGYNLPFGCHGWPKYDRDFWEPYLLKSL